MIEGQSTRHGSVISPVRSVGVAAREWFPHSIACGWCRLWTSLWCVVSLYTDWEREVGKLGIL